MIYAVYYRGDGETRWLLLKDKLTDKFYSFDASLLPDGGYTVKVVASDAPSHLSGEALTAEKRATASRWIRLRRKSKISRRRWRAAQIHVSFRAVDSFSPIQHAECSVDAGDWQFIEPADQISDSKTENYDFRIPVPPASGDKTAGDKTAGAGARGRGSRLRPLRQHEFRQNSNPSEVAHMRLLQTLAWAALRAFT